MCCELPVDKSPNWQCRCLLYQHTPTLCVECVCVWQLRQTDFLTYMELHCFLVFFLADFLIFAPLSLYIIKLSHKNTTQNCNVLLKLKHFTHLCLNLWCIYFQSVFVCILASSKFHFESLNAAEWHSSGIFLQNDLSRDWKLLPLQFTQIFGSAQFPCAA